MKRIQNFTVESRATAGGCTLLTLAPQPGTPDLYDVRPGQFVEVRVDTPGVMLRRPISVCDVTADGRLVLMVKRLGRGSEALAALAEGAVVNLVLPLGNGFDLDACSGGRALLAGGGVGVAPLVYLSKALARRGASVTVVIGARTAADLEGVAGLFPAGVNLAFTTDDGSLGTHGFVPDAPAFAEPCDVIYCCGPTPMMKAVARAAAARAVPCQASLENMMACGVGACLCCVEKTTQGHLCVCTDGPVFNTTQLLWT